MNPIFTPKNNSALALAISVLVFVGIVFTFNFAGWRDSFLTAAKGASTSIPVPTSLSTTALSSTQIGLNWTDNSTNENGFKIERQQGTGSFSQIATVGANVTTYTNSALSPSTLYTYRVRAYGRGNKNSSYSNTSSATTLAASPDTTPPSVSIPSPVSQTYTTAQTVTITASASDNVGVTKVEFYDNGVLKVTDTASPYTYSWSISSAQNGTHNFTAKATYPTKIGWRRFCNIL